MLRFVLSNYSLTFSVLGLIAAGTALSRKPKPLSHEVIWDRILAYYCLIGTGLYMIYNFVVHCFFGEMAAEFIGWEDSPFQFEVGSSSLGFGLIGLLAFRRDFGLRLAAVVGPAKFMWGAAVVHIRELVNSHNFAPGNAGITFWTDILLPIIGFAFLWAWQRAQSSDVMPRGTATLQAAPGR